MVTINNQNGSEVGLDISKNRLDGYSLSTGEHFAYENTPNGCKKMCEMLLKITPSLVTLEATGGYEIECMLAMHEAGIPFHRINPRRGHDYARSRGIHAKTDKLDAKILAEFGHERQLEPQELPAENMRKLRELFTWQQQLTTRISTLKIQLQQSRNSFVQNDMEELLKSDQKKFKSVEDEIARYIHDDPDTDEKDEILQSVPGVGPKTSYAILVALPEIGKLAPRAASSLAGVAPMNCDSGKKKGPRHICGGRPEVRTALYMAVITGAVRGINPVLSRFYRKLIAAGKPFKVAVIACVRKLLVILNTMIRTKTMWNENSAKA